VALANIAKVDAVAAAAIAKINGLVFTAAAPGAFLLDTYTGAAAGYSVRRLATSATVLLRVRRETAGGTGDDDEADVAYDSNNILSLDSAISNASAGVTATTLGQFLNVGTVGGTTYTNPDSLTVTASCYVDTWYNQAGSNDAEQTAFGSQPQIHNGTVNTDLITENGKPAVDFNIDVLQAVSIFSQSSAVLSFFIVFKEDDTNANNRAVVLSGDVEQLTEVFASQNFAFGNTQNSGHRRPENENAAVGTANNNQNLFAYWKNGTNNQNLSVNAGTAGSNTNSVTTTTLTDIYLGAAASNLGNPLNGRIQEFVLWFSDQDTAGNRTGIEENINSEYLIYQPTDTPTSGLLATYTGAAAAYSVRQLANTAVIALRVRRDSDDEETNIGFDANGDLDSQAISDFCSTANGYVTRWWDQSTNGNHADQATDASQPQIYNGTAVITENGKPALEFDGSNDLMDSPTMTVTDGEFMQTAVYANNTNVANSAVATLDTSPVRVAQTIQFPNTTTVRLLTFNSSGGIDAIISASTTSAGTQTLATSHVLNGQGEVFVNGVGALTGTVNVRTDQTTIRLGNNLSGNGPLDGRVQEVIHWPSEQTNRTAIESNIDTYFSIT